MNCPDCYQELPETPGLESCPKCGYILAKPPAPVPTAAPLQKQTIYWGVFWVAFIVGPLFGILAASTRQIRGALWFSLAGPIVAGFALAKIFTKTPGMFVLAGIFYAIGVIAIYIGIAYVGCLVIAGGSTHF